MTDAGKKEGGGFHMIALDFARARVSRAGGWVSRLVNDRRGVAAVEFAFVVPLLLSMYFVTMEVGQAIETNKKVGRMGSMVADLVTQQQEVSKADLKNILMIGDATLQPYFRSKPIITVVAVTLNNDATPKATVDWSYKMENGEPVQGPAKGNPVTIPEALRTPGGYLIQVEAVLPYKPVITWAADSKKPLGLAGTIDNFTMTETYYLRPRISTTIKCKDC